MRKLWTLILALCLVAPTTADQADLTRFETVIEYLTENSKSQPSSESLMMVANSALTSSNSLPTKPRANLYESLIAAEDNGVFHKRILNAVLASLNDPWARIYTPEEVEQVRSRLSGGREGAMGVTVIQVDKPASFRIVGVSPGSPAEGKLQTGDSILSANGVMASDEGFRDVITGESGKPVSLQVVNETGQKRDVSLQLSDFESKTAFVVNQETGLIRITSFGANTAQELNEAMLQLEGRPAIIDLRFNGGGYITSAVDSSSLFLSRGEKIVTTVSPKSTEVHSAVDDKVEFRQPVCLLVNNRTASAAEIFTAALRTHVGAYVVGDKTYGKGSVQRLVSLPGNWALKYTTSLYQTPNGEFIDKVGIEPDRDIEMEPALTASSADTQLAEALNWSKHKSSVASSH